MPLVEIEVARIALALLGTAAAAYQDAKTSFIDEKITYSMIATGVLLTLLSIDFSSPDWNFITGAFGGAALIFGAGYVLYRQGQVGGGDVLLFTGLHLLLPIRPIEFATPLLAILAPELSIAQALAYQRALSVLPFALSVFTAASFFALVGSALFYAKSLYGKRLQPDLVSAAIFGGACLALIAWLYSNSGDAAQSLFFAVLAGSAAFLAAFKKQILEEVVVQKISLDEVEDEDILATNLMDKKIVEKYSIGRVLTKEEVKKLEAVSIKEGICVFPVAKVLPRLGPYILLGLVTTLLIGDLFAFFIVLK